MSDRMIEVLEEEAEVLDAPEVAEKPKRGRAAKVVEAVKPEADPVLAEEPTLETKTADEDEKLSVFISSQGISYTTIDGKKTLPVKINGLVAQNVILDTAQFVSRNVYEVLQGLIQHRSGNVHRQAGE
jgi:hypothetical protein